MRIKLDENIPAGLAQPLIQLGHDTDTVEQEGLTGASDQVVWKAAKSESRLLVTQDLDFADTRLFSNESHCGILILRLRQPGLLALTSKIINIFTNEPVEKWANAVVIATENKLRIRRNYSGEN